MSPILADFNIKNIFPANLINQCVEYVYRTDI